MNSKVLPMPVSQLCEVLYEHLTSEWISDAEIHNNTHILKPCARRSELRSLGINFIKEEISRVNKHGRATSYAKFKLEDWDYAYDVYNKINKLPSNWKVAKV